MAKSFGASEREIWWKILVPGAMPPILAGLRIGMGRAVAGMVIVELLLVATGVGKLLLEFRGLFQKELLFAVVFVVLAESVGLMAIMRYLEQKFVPWANDIAVD
jgi:NitT/TauT family transport system permease protein